MAEEPNEISVDDLDFPNEDGEEAPNLDGNETPKGDQTPTPKDGEKNEEGEKKPEQDKPSRAEIAQKIKYREKADKLQQENERLKGELEAKKGKPADPSDEDETEKRAKEYIRKQAMEVVEEILKERENETKRVTEAFNAEVTETLEEFTELKEDQLVDACQEFQVSPKVAAKILKKMSERKPVAIKPNLPTPKRGSYEVKVKDDKPVDNSGKDIYQIAKEVKEALKKAL